MATVTQQLAGPKVPLRRTTAPCERSLFGHVRLDGCGRVLSADAAARHIADVGDALRIDAAGISAIRASDNARLIEVLDAAHRAAPQRLFSLTIPRRAGGRDYLLLVSRVADPRGGVHVSILDPEGTLRLPVELLSSIFRLTPMQSKLAERLAVGESIVEAARVLGIKQGTARIHLTSIYRKTNTKRLGELVHLLCSLSMIVGIQSATSRFVIDGETYNGSHETQPHDAQAFDFQGISLDGTKLA